MTKQVWIVIFGNPLKKKFKFLIDNKFFWNGSQCHFLYGLVTVCMTIVLAFMEMNHYNFHYNWAKNSEKNDISGILLWDLSAAFDTLDVDIFCQKIKLFGFLPNTVKWFKSFLTGRSQSVKIGTKISSKRDLNSGVPQGGVISPLIFVLYVADFEFWLKWSVAKTYADDTMTRTTAKNKEELIRRMEEDACNILKYMASNGLIANANKTSLVILNLKKKDVVPNNPLQISIGNATVSQVSEAKLLGIKFNQKQKWNSQIQGSGGVVSSLNKRLFVIKRLKNHVGISSLNKLVDGLFTSKINYGLQLYGKVRVTENDPKKQGS